jgi:aminoglycoside phosphotransferase family enzyme
MTADETAGQGLISGGRAGGLVPAEILAALRDPATYPQPPGVVTARETHMSWVFLTDRFVYKLKKPVRLNSLDYTTLERRRACCEAEITLNRRLAPAVYLGAVPLARTAGGGLRLEAEGTAVEWLVKMRRLAEARMLDVAVAYGTATRADVACAATLLAGFFRAAPAERIADAAYLGRFAHDLALDRALLCDPAFGLADARPGDLLDRLGTWVETEREALLARLHTGQVIEGHGDLRPEHIFLGPPPAVIDGLEFDRTLRLLDPAEEVAFLALECDRLGAPWAGAIFRARCLGARGTAPPQNVTAFYTAFHACLRARLCVGHLQDAPPRATDTWLAKARWYLRKAWDAAALLSLPAGR